MARCTHAWIRIMQELEVSEGFQPMVSNPAMCSAHSALKSAAPACEHACTTQPPHNAVHFADPIMHSISLAPAPHVCTAAHLSG